MWAQLIKMSMKPGREPDLSGLFDQLHAAEQPDSGLQRTIAMQDENDPNRVYFLVVFDSEARARERDPRRQEALKSVQAAMAELFSDGQACRRPRPASRSSDPREH